MNLRPNPSLAAQRSGSVFILVLWIAFGLVVLALGVWLIVRGSRRVVP